MSKIDYQALREAAEKATPGDWRRASTRFNGITSQAVYPLCGKEEILANTAEKRDAEFIAAANPATVLALLDELDKWQQESSAWQAVAEKQLDFAADAEKRIAELESLKAPQLPQQAVPECYQRLLHHAYGMTIGHDWNKGMMAGHHREKLCKAVEDCRAAMLQGDEPVTDNTNQQFESLSRGAK